MKQIINQYEQICSDIVNAFAEKQGIDFDYWVGDDIGGVASFIEQYSFNTHEMVFDLKTEQPVALITSWIDDMVQHYQDYPDRDDRINYQSYAMGLRYADLLNREPINCELKSNGLKCDNEVCDWADETIPILDWENWVNKSCPKCGKNVLTEKDFANAKLLIEAYKLINEYTDEELAKITNYLATDHPEDYAAFKALMGLTDDDEKVRVRIGTHEDITIEKIDVIKE